MKTPRPFALLDALRPPAGHRTTWAIGTTYSLDIVAAAAVLGALDRAAREEADAPLSGTLRALHRLKERVRIFAQQGCVVASTRVQPRLVGLFDAIVRHVPFPLETRCFHPKVWIARQQNHDGEARWVLVVSSKNISCDPSWEAGVALVGAEARTTNLPTVRAFVEHAARLGGEEAFAKTARHLDTVEWELPRGVRDARFAWHAGDGRACTNEDGHPRGLPEDARDVLVISPFVDRATLRALSKQFAAAENARIVAGRVDLDRALSKGMDVLGSFKAHTLGVACDPLDLDEDEPGAASDEASEGDARGLHAKVIATRRSAADATVMVGSANMTGRAWGGTNCEAWVVLRGRSEVLFDPMVAWAEAVAPLEYRCPSASAPPEDSPLERMHARVSSSIFRLDERLPEARLTADPNIDLDSGGEFFVSRPAVQGSEVRWSAGGAVLSACASSERSRFLAMRLRVGNETKRWLQIVDVDPPIGQERDAAALRDLVAPERLPALLRSLLDERYADGDPDGEPPARRPTGALSTAGGGSGGSDDSLSLEVLLALVERARRDCKDSELLADASRLVADYRARSEPSSALAELFEAWDAIREVFG